jgi:hypothetical protein
MVFKTHSSFTSIRLTLLINWAAWTVLILVACLNWLCQRLVAYLDSLYQRWQQQRTPTVGSGIDLAPNPDSSSADALSCTVQRSDSMESTNGYGSSSSGFGLAKDLDDKGTLNARYSTTGSPYMEIISWGEFLAGKRFKQCSSHMV